MQKRNNNSPGIRLAHVEDLLHRVMRVVPVLLLVMTTTGEENAST